MDGYGCFPDADWYEMEELDAELRQAGIPHEIFNIFAYEGATREELRAFADDALSRYGRITCFERKETL